jgi:hypothetical protein
MSAHSKKHPLHGYFIMAVYLIASCTSTLNLGMIISIYYDGCPVNFPSHSAMGLPLFATHAHFNDIKHTMQAYFSPSGAKAQSKSE